MKIPYFTPETIESQAWYLLREARKVRQRETQSFKPRCSALLVLDMQDYFLDASSHAIIPSAPAIVPGILSLVEAFAKHNLLVVFTRHLNTPDNALMMSKWWQDLIDPNLETSKINDAFKGNHYQAIVKHQYDAFYETPLEKIIRDKKLEQVVICGVMTHLCCETTARSAFMRGFEVFFTVDGTATYNRDFHRSTLVNLAHGFATPVLIGDLLEEF